MNQCPCYDNDGDKMKKILFSCCLILCLFSLSACRSKDIKEVDDLTSLNFSDLNGELMYSKDITVYFAWPDSDEFTKQFQEEYLNDEIMLFDAFQNIYFINLDKELPLGYADESKRDVLTQSYGISSAPAFVHYKAGKQKELLEYKGESLSEFKEKANAFFTSIGYLD